QAGRREHAISANLAAIVQHDAADSVVVDFHPLHTGSQTNLAAELLESPDEIFQDLANARPWPSETFLKDAAKHDRELTEIHVVFSRSAVVLQRAEQHVDQQRIANPTADDRAGGLCGERSVEIIVVHNRRGELVEVRAFGWKRLVDFATEQFEVVRELERYTR